MIPKILQYSLISFILIILLHSLYNFFKSTLTIPKIQDMVEKPKKYYEEIYNEIEKNKLEQNEKDKNNNKSKLSTIDTSLMKNELKNYLNGLQKKTTQGFEIDKQFQSFSEF